MSMKPKMSAEAAPSDDNKAVRATIREAVAGLQYGQVTLVIKAGKITQIDRTEKQRFTGVEGHYGDGI